MATMMVDGFECDLQFSKEFRHAVLDLWAPAGMCFSGGEHCLSLDHTHGIRADMVREMLMIAGSQQLRQCDCEDCNPVDWFAALKVGDSVKAARDLTHGQDHWFADSGEKLVVTSVAGTEDGRLFIGVRRSRNARSASSFKVGREDVCRS